MEFNKNTTVTSLLLSQTPNSDTALVISVARFYSTRTGVQRLHRAIPKLAIVMLFEYSQMRSLQSVFLSFVYDVYAYLICVSIVHMNIYVQYGKWSIKA